MARMRIDMWLLLLTLCVDEAVRANAATPPVQPVARVRTDVETMMVIHAYKDGLAGVRAANPDLHLSVGRDPTAPDEPVLFVEYPAPTADPAGRDVQLASESHDWSGGRAIAFNIKPARGMRLSVSFLDRNRVVYTAWKELEGGVWQLVQIPFDEIRPNPYFQLPGVKTDAPLDVSAVNGIALAPQDRAAGQMIIGRFVVSR
jgi:hypothetical protein